MGIFSKNHAPDPNVKRNTFDLSFQNNLTMRMGTLYPCFCKEVLPGDTFKIDTAFGLRFMPLVFPIQTKLRADVHYFYVRNRNLWKEWPNFIGDNSNNGSLPRLSPQRAKEQCTTGSLGDYLGLPSTLVGADSHSFSNSLLSFVDDSYTIHLLEGFDNPNALSVVMAPGSHDKYVDVVNERPSAPKKPIDSWMASMVAEFGTDESLSVGDTIDFVFADMANLYGVFKPESLVTWLQPCDQSGSLIYGPALFSKGEFISKVEMSAGSGIYLYTYRYKVLAPLDVKKVYGFRAFVFNPLPLEGSFPFNMSMSYSYVSRYFVKDFGSIDNTDDVPFEVNALPFRAYESIYNAFYRDQRNNPYVVDGENRPNEYLPSVDGGEDAHEYKLRQRNWEQDFLTSALPSPQMGAAPLVGMTSSGVASFQSEDGTIYKVKMQVADDGDTITSAEYSNNLPNDVARSIVNIASSGLSINDFRAVNSLQRWLEANFRKGLKYKDQLAAHFGVDASYSVLDMPEFIGGCSQSVDVQQINQTSETTSDNPLGSYAGQAYAVGGSSNTIQHYCDEHGYIIGIISVVPVPCYSQLLPKHFTKFDTLDYYFPEFGHIGLQPVPYREVCPLQASKSGISLSSTFGYQRAWYDYLASTDEVHGDFRLSLRDFVLSRVFKALPSLTPDFLTVDEDDMNNVFAVDEGDHILGQVHFKVHAKRPIPRYGIPRLE